MPIILAILFGFFLALSASAQYQTTVSAHSTPYTEATENEEGIPPHQLNLSNCHTNTGYHIKQQGSALHIEVQGVGPGFQSLTCFFEVRDFSKVPVLRAQLKKTPTSPPARLRMDLLDTEGHSTNAHPVEVNIDNGEHFKEYVFDFQGKFRTSGTTHKNVDKQKIHGIVFFLNPERPPYKGTVYIEQIVHRNASQEAAPNGTGESSLAASQVPPPKANTRDHGHAGHTQKPASASSSEHPSAAAGAPMGHKHHAQEHTDTEETTGEHAMHMSSTLLPNLPMQRDGSGTAWLPDAAPMYGTHLQAGAWNLMLHGGAFFRYTTQDAFESGERGASKLSVPNWFMIMGKRQLNTRSQLALRGMFTLEPLIDGGAGYPLLFQTGETYEGEPLIDQQHPHDLFAELAITYGWALNEKTGFFAYFGLPGEPALGPTAFMHRPSAQHNPASPISHHWQDATHILFGVATLGIRKDIWKLDGSLFTGREPNEERFGFDRPRFDSYSFRLSTNPNKHWALQASHAFLKSPEVHDPEIDQRRTTASVLYNHPMGKRGQWSTSLIWGFNEPIQNDVTVFDIFDDSDSHDDGHDDSHDVPLGLTSGHGHSTAHSLLLESDLELGKQAFYTRLEWIEKSGGELGATSFADRIFRISTITLGTAHDLATFGSLRFMLGGQATFYRVPGDIQSFYGEHPVSFDVYLRLSPTRVL